MLAKFTNEFHQGETKAHMLNIQKQNREKRKPISELNVVCNATLKDLKTVFDGKVSKQGEQQKHQAKRARVTPIVSASRPGTVLFEKGPDTNGTPIITMDVEKATAEFSDNASAPMIIKMSEDVLKSLTAAEMGKSLTEFKKAFNKSQDRATKGRGGRRLGPSLSDDLVATAIELGKAVLPAGALQACAKLDEKVMIPSWFGLQQDSISTAMEIDNLASVRASIQGAF